MQVQVWGFADEEPTPVHPSPAARGLRPEDCVGKQKQGAATKSAVVKEVEQELDEKLVRRWPCGESETRREGDSHGHVEGVQADGISWHPEGKVAIVRGEAAGVEIFFGGQEAASDV